MKKQRRRTRLRSPLQEKILNHICLTKDADYHTLSKATERDRITILQSVGSLLDHAYIKKEKEKFDQVRSKLRFLPTDKGKAYVIEFSKVDLDKIQRTHLPPDALLLYDQRMSNIEDVEARKKNEEGVYKVCLLNDLFNEDGSLPDQKKLMNTQFRIMLSQFAHSKGFDLEKLFDPEDIGDFNKMYDRSEREDLIKIFAKLRDNLDLSIKKLSK